jgi:hypothetical protein
MANDPTLVLEETHGEHVHSEILKIKMISYRSRVHQANAPSCRGQDYWFAGSSDSLQWLNLLLPRFKRFILVVPRFKRFILVVKPSLSQVPNVHCGFGKPFSAGSGVLLNHYTVGKSHKNTKKPFNYIKHHGRFIANLMRR